MNDYNLRPIEWLRLLYQVWGMCHQLTAGDVAAIERVALPGETAMATCARLAGVNVTGVQPFDHAHVRQLCAAREVVLARE